MAEDAAGLRVAIAYDCLFPATTGGGERVYRRIADALTDRGASVDYITRTQWRRGHRPAASFEIVEVWSGDIHDATGTRTPRSALGFASALFRYFRGHRRSHELVIVAALPVLNVFAVYLALLGTRTVLLVDWLEIWPWRKWRTYSGLVTGSVAAALQSLALRLGEILTVNSGFTRRRVLERRRNADPIVLGLIDLVSTLTDTGAAHADPPFVLFVGRHIADKRLPVLPAALVVARRSIPTLRAVIVGTGPETETARTRTETEGLSDQIRFAGRVSNEELVSLFASASALVNPSAREGFGLVVAEAAAFGTPSVVVAGEDNAAAELVTDDVNGFVAPSAEPDELGAAIVRAVSSDGLRDRTLAWFDDARITGGLELSLDSVLRRYRSLTTR